MTRKEGRQVYRQLVRLINRYVVRDLSEISRGGGGWKQRVGHNFLRLRKGRGHEKSTIKRGRVMQIYAHDHVEVHPQKKKEVLYLIKRKRKKRTMEHYGYRL